MTTQMIIRMDPETKDRIGKLARVEGKTTSQMVRELTRQGIKSDKRIYGDQDINPSAVLEDLPNSVN